LALYLEANNKNIFLSEFIMFAVVQFGGHQYKVRENDTIFVDRLAQDADASVTSDRVLLVANGDEVTVGTPVVESASVEATVVNHLKGDKVIVFKKKRRKGYQKSNGHRQHLTQLKIEKITL
jgi:large subunit ribosomal protein L21